MSAREITAASTQLNWKSWTECEERYCQDEASKTLQFTYGAQMNTIRAALALVRTWQELAREDQSAQPYRIANYVSPVLRSLPLGIASGIGIGFATTVILGLGLTFANPSPQLAALLGLIPSRIKGLLFTTTIASLVVGTHVISATIECINEHRRQRINQICGIFHRYYLDPQSNSDR